MFAHGIVFTGRPNPVTGRTHDMGGCELSKLDPAVYRYEHGRPSQPKGKQLGRVVDVSKVLYGGTGTALERRLWNLGGGFPLIWAVLELDSSRAVEELTKGDLWLTGWIRSHNEFAHVTVGGPGKPDQIYRRAFPGRGDEPVVAAVVKKSYGMEPYSFYCSKCKFDHAGECAVIEKYVSKAVDWNQYLPAKIPPIDVSVPWQVGEVWASRYQHLGGIPGDSALVFRILSARRANDYHEIEILAGAGLWEKDVGKTREFGRASAVGERARKVGGP